MRRRHVPWVVGLVGIALAALTGPSVAADDQPPVTVPDEVTVLPGGSHRLDVLRNDSDDLGQQALCRARGSAAAEATVDRGRVYVNVPTDQPGDYRVQYQACDHEYLSLGTVTVHAVAPEEVTVERVPDRPGVLRATNPNPVRVIVIWVRPHSERLGGHVKLAAGASRDFTVDSRRIVYLAFDPTSHWEDGSLLGLGRIGHIELPAAAPTRGAALTGRYDELWRTLHHAPARHDRAVVRRDAPWPSDPTTVQPPVAHVDTIHWWAGSWDRVPVTANDVDPQGQEIDVCRLGPEATTPSITTALTPSVIDGQLDLGTDRHAEGTWEVPYYVCNNGRLAPAVLRVVVTHAKPLHVRRLARDPHLVRVHNPNPERVGFWVGHYVRYGRVAPYATKVIRVPASARHWEGMIGPHSGWAGSGSIG